MVDRVSNLTIDGVRLIKDLKVIELRAELEERGLSKYGNKRELVQRLSIFEETRQKSKSTGQQNQEPPNQWLENEADLNNDFLREYFKSQKALFQEQVQRKQQIGVSEYPQESVQSPSTSREPALSSYLKDAPTQSGLQTAATTSSLFPVSTKKRGRKRKENLEPVCKQVTPLKICSEDITVNTVSTRPSRSSAQASRVLSLVSFEDDDSMDKGSDGSFDFAVKPRKKGHRGSRGIGHRRLSSTNISTSPCKPYPAFEDQSSECERSHKVPSLKIKLPESVPKSSTSIIISPVKESINSKVKFLQDENLKQNITKSVTQVCLSPQNAEVSSSVQEETPISLRIKSSSIDSHADSTSNSGSESEILHSDEQKSENDTTKLTKADLIASKSQDVKTPKTSLFLDTEQWVCEDKPSKSELHWSSRTKVKVTKLRKNSEDSTFPIASSESSPSIINNGVVMENFLQQPKIKDIVVSKPLRGSRGRRRRRRGVVTSVHKNVDTVYPHISESPICIETKLKKDLVNLRLRDDSSSSRETSSNSSQTFTKELTLSSSSLDKMSLRRSSRISKHEKKTVKDHKKELLISSYGNTMPPNSHISPPQQDIKSSANPDFIESLKQQIEMPLHVEKFPLSDKSEVSSTSELTDSPKDTVKEVKNLSKFQSYSVDTPILDAHIAVEGHLDSRFAPDSRGVDSSTTDEVSSQNSKINVPSLSSYLKNKTSLSINSTTLPFSCKKKELKSTAKKSGYLIENLIDNLSEKLSSRCKNTFESKTNVQDVDINKEVKPIFPYQKSTASESKVFLKLADSRLELNQPLGTKDKTSHVSSRSSEENSTQEIERKSSLERYVCSVTEFKGSKEDQDTKCSVSAIPKASASCEANSSCTSAAANINKETHFHNKEQRHNRRKSQDSTKLSQNIYGVTAVSDKKRKYSCESVDSNKSMSDILKEEIFSADKERRLSQESQGSMEHRRLSQESQGSMELRSSQVSQGKERRLSQESQGNKERRHSEESQSSKERRLSQESHGNKERRLSQESHGNKERRLSQENQGRKEYRFSQESHGSKERRPSEESQGSKERQLSHESYGNKERRFSQESQGSNKSYQDILKEAALAADIMEDEDLESGSYDGMLNQDNLSTYDSVHLGKSIIHLTSSNIDASKPELISIKMHCEEMSAVSTLISPNDTKSSFLTSKCIGVPTATTVDEKVTNTNQNTWPPLIIGSDIEKNSILYKNLIKKQDISEERSVSDSVCNKKILDSKKDNSIRYEKSSSECDVMKFSFDDEQVKEPIILKELGLHKVIASTDKAKISHLFTSMKGSTSLEPRENKNIIESSINDKDVAFGEDKLNLQTYFDAQISCDKPVLALDNKTAVQETTITGYDKEKKSILIPLKEDHKSVLIEHDKSLYTKCEDVGDMKMKNDNFDFLESQKKDKCRPGIIKCTRKGVLLHNILINKCVEPMLSSNTVSQIVDKPLVCAQENVICNKDEEIVISTKDAENVVCTKNEENAICTKDENVNTKDEENICIKDEHIENMSQMDKGEISNSLVRNIFTDDEHKFADNVTENEKSKLHFIFNKKTDSVIGSLQVPCDEKDMLNTADKKFITGSKKSVNISSEVVHVLSEKTPVPDKALPMSMEEISSESTQQFDSTSNKTHDMCTGEKPEVPDVDKAPIDPLEENLVDAQEEILNAPDQVLITTTDNHKLPTVDVDKKLPVSATSNIVPIIMNEKVSIAVKKVIDNADKNRNNSQASEIVIEKNEYITSNEIQKVFNEKNLSTGFDEKSTPAASVDVCLINTPDNIHADVDFDHQTVLDSLNEKITNIGDRNLSSSTGKTSDATEEMMPDKFHKTSITENNMHRAQQEKTTTIEVETHSTLEIRSDDKINTSFEKMPVPTGGIILKKQEQIVNATSKDSTVNHDEDSDKNKYAIISDDNKLKILNKTLPVSSSTELVVHHEEKSSSDNERVFLIANKETNTGKDTNFDDENKRQTSLEHTIPPIISTKKLVMSDPGKCATFSVDELITAQEDKVRSDMENPSAVEENEQRVKVLDEKKTMTNDTMSLIFDNKINSNESTVTDGATELLNTALEIKSIATSTEGALKKSVDEKITSFDHTSTKDSKYDLFVNEVVEKSESSSSNIQFISDEKSGDNKEKLIPTYENEILIMTDGKEPSTSGVNVLSSFLNLNKCATIPDKKILKRAELTASPVKNKGDSTSLNNSEKTSSNNSEKIALVTLETNNDKFTFSGIEISVLSTEDNRPEVIPTEKILLEKVPLACDVEKQVSYDEKKPEGTTIENSCVLDSMPIAFDTTKSIASNNNKSKDTTTEKSSSLSDKIPLTCENDKSLSFEDKSKDTKHEISSVSDKIPITCDTEMSFIHDDKKAKFTTTQKSSSDMSKTILIICGAEKLVTCDDKKRDTETDNSLYDVKAMTSDAEKSITFDDDTKSKDLKTEESSSVSDKEPKTYEIEVPLTNDGSKHEFLPAECTLTEKTGSKSSKIQITSDAEKSVTYDISEDTVAEKNTLLSNKIPLTSEKKKSMSCDVKNKDNKHEINSVPNELPISDTEKSSIYDKKTKFTATQKSCSVLKKISISCDDEKAVIYVDKKPEDVETEKVSSLSDMIAVTCESEKSVTFDNDTKTKDLTNEESSSISDKMPKTYEIKIAVTSDDDKREFSTAETISSPLSRVPITSNTDKLESYNDKPKGITTEKNSAKISLSIDTAFENSDTRIAEYTSTEKTSSKSAKILTYVDVSKNTIEEKSSLTDKIFNVSGTEKSLTCDDEKPRAILTEKISSISDIIQITCDTEKLTNDDINSEVPIKKINSILDNPIICDIPTSDSKERINVVESLSSDVKKQMSTNKKPMFNEEMPLTTDDKNLALGNDLLVKPYEGKSLGTHGITTSDKTIYGKRQQEVLASEIIESLDNKFTSAIDKAPVIITDSQKLSSEKKLTFIPVNKVLAPDENYNKAIVDEKKSMDSSDEKMQEVSLRKKLISESKEPKEMAVIKTEASSDVKMIFDASKNIATSNENVKLSDATTNETILFHAPELCLKSPDKNYNKAIVDEKKSMDSSDEKMQEVSLRKKLISESKEPKEMVVIKTEASSDVKMIFDASKNIATSNENVKLSDATTNETILFHAPELCSKSPDENYNKAIVDEKKSMDSSDEKMQEVSLRKKLISESKEPKEMVVIKTEASSDVKMIFDASKNIATSNENVKLSDATTNETILFHAPELCSKSPDENYNKAIVDEKKSMDSSDEKMQEVSLRKKLISESKEPKEMVVIKTEASSDVKMIFDASKNIATSNENVKLSDATTNETILFHAPELCSKSLSANVTSKTVSNTLETLHDQLKTCTNTSHDQTTGPTCKEKLLAVVVKHKYISIEAAPSSKMEERNEENVTSKTVSNTLETLHDQLKTCTNTSDDQTTGPTCKEKPLAVVVKHKYSVEAAPSSKMEERNEENVTIKTVSNTLETLHDQVKTCTNISHDQTTGPTCKEKLLAVVVKHKYISVEAAPSSKMEERNEENLETVCTALTSDIEPISINELRTVSDIKNKDLTSAKYSNSDEIFNESSTLIEKLIKPNEIIPVAVDSLELKIKLTDNKAKEDKKIPISSVEERNITLNSKNEPTAVSCQKENKTGPFSPKSSSVDKSNIALGSKKRTAAVPSKEGNKTGPCSQKSAWYETNMVFGSVKRKFEEREQTCSFKAPSFKQEIEKSVTHFEESEASIKLNRKETEINFLSEVQDKEPISHGKRSWYETNMVFGISKQRKYDEVSKQDNTSVNQLSKSRMTIPFKLSESIETSTKSINKEMDAIALNKQPSELKDDFINSENSPDPKTDTSELKEKALNIIDFIDEEKAAAEAENKEIRKSVITYKKAICFEDLTNVEQEDQLDTKNNIITSKPSTFSLERPDESKNICLPPLIECAASVTCSPETLHNPKEKSQPADIGLVKEVLKEKINPNLVWAMDKNIQDSSHLLLNKLDIDEKFKVDKNSQVTPKESDKQESATAEISTIDLSFNDVNAHISMKDFSLIPHKTDTVKDEYDKDANKTSVEAEALLQRCDFGTHDNKNKVVSKEQTKEQTTDSHSDKVVLKECTTDSHSDQSSENFINKNPFDFDLSEIQLPAERKIADKKKVVSLSLISSLKKGKITAKDIESKNFRSVKNSGIDGNASEKSIRERQFVRGKESTFCIKMPKISFPLKSKFSSCDTSQDKMEQDVLLATEKKERLQVVESLQEESSNNDTKLRRNSNEEITLRNVKNYDLKEKINVPVSKSELWKSSWTNKHSVAKPETIFRECNLLDLSSIPLPPLDPQHKEATISSNLPSVHDAKEVKRPWQAIQMARNKKAEPTADVVINKKEGSNGDLNEGLNSVNEIKMPPQPKSNNSEEDKHALPTNESERPLLKAKISLNSEAKEKEELKDTDQELKQDLDRNGASTLEKKIPRSTDTGKDSNKESSNPEGAINNASNEKNDGEKSKQDADNKIDDPKGHHEGSPKVKERSDDANRLQKQTDSSKSLRERRSSHRRRSRSSSASPYRRRGRSKSSSNSHSPQRRSSRTSSQRTSSKSSRSSDRRRSRERESRRDRNESRDFRRKDSSRKESKPDEFSKKSASGRSKHEPPSRRDPKSDDPKKKLDLKQNKEENATVEKLTEAPAAKKEDASQEKGPEGERIDKPEDKEKVEKSANGEVASEKKQDEEEKEEKVATTMEVVTPFKSARKVSLSRSKSQDEEKDKPKRKKWGTSAANKPSLEISSFSLKSLMPDVKPLTPSELTLRLESGNESEESEEEEEEEEREQGEIPMDDDKEEKTERRKKRVKSEDSDKELEEKRKETSQSRRRRSSSRDRSRRRREEGETATRGSSPHARKRHSAKSPERSPHPHHGRKIRIVEAGPSTFTKLLIQPAKNPVSKVIQLHNLVRPFTIKQLKDLLQRTGRLLENGFWIDSIKSNCLAMFESEDQAQETRMALHGVKWPTINPKNLDVEFSTEEEIKRKLLETAYLQPQPPLDEPKRDRRRMDGPVREWDLAKLGERSPGEREREKERIRREREEERIREREKLMKAHTSKEKSSKKAVVKSLDDLFKKTKARPSIYWLPLTSAQIAEKEAQRRKRIDESERVYAEMKAEREKQRAEREKEAEKQRQKRKEREREREKEREKEKEKSSRRSRSRSKRRSRSRSTRSPRRSPRRSRRSGSRDLKRSHKSKSHSRSSSRSRS